MSMIVTTTRGDLRATTHDGVVAALGIPFAQTVRFAAPEPVVSWSGARDATEFGAASLQPPGEVFLAVDMAQSEDCLTCNVWAPEAAVNGSGPSRPVMVWIHGGGFRQGAGAHMLSRGPVLAARGDVVVVTVNYRLGALGFATHPDLSEDGTCGNRAIEDLVTALRWVRDEIGAFGGDAGNVTLFGESAGGTLVSILATMPIASGLFRRVIVQSGVPTAIDLERASRLTEELAREAGASGVRQLRNVPGEAVLAAQIALEARRGGRMVFIPAVDGVLVERTPVDAFSAGAAAGTPMIIGTNVDEMRLLGAGDPHRLDLDEAGLRVRLERVLEGDVGQVIDAVRSARAARGEGTSPSDLWFAIETDRFFRVPSLRAADAHVAHDPRTYVYLFGWRSPAFDGWLGACHVLEIPFVFGLQDAPHLAPFTGAGADGARLSAEMMGAWVTFARGDDPSTPGLSWPRHDPGARPTLVFDERSRAEAAPRDEERAAVAAHSGF